MLVYIAGKVTGDPGYQKKFARAAEVLESKGFEVMNPAVLPETMDYEAAMRVCTAMLKECDAICLLDDWQRSPGAQREFQHAFDQDMKIMKLEYEPICTYMSYPEANEWIVEMEKPA